MATKEENAVAAMTTNTSKAALPAYLQGKEKQSRIGNIDQTDLIIPRVKLLQAISPEVAEQNLPGAAPGMFWHTVAAEPLGKELIGVPIVVRKSIVLWSPRNDDRGVLARSSNGVDWDKGFENLKFEVKPKGSPSKIEYYTDANVKASGLADFGSSIPGDPQSPPAAALTYNFMWYFPEFKHYSPAIIINTRSAVKPAKMLLSNLDQNPVDAYYRKFIIKTVDMVGAEGPYKGYAYQADGYVEEDVAAITKGLYDQFSSVDWRANEEDDEAAPDLGGAAGGEVGGKGNKF